MDAIKRMQCTPFMQLTHCICASITVSDDRARIRISARPLTPMGTSDVARCLGLEPLAHIKDRRKGCGGSILQACELHPDPANSPNLPLSRFRQLHKSFPSPLFLSRLIMTTLPPPFPAHEKTHAKILPPERAVLSHVHAFTHHLETMKQCKKERTALRM